MRKLHNNKSILVAIAFALVTLASSCSREMCKLTQSNQLMRVQTLAKYTPPVQKQNVVTTPDEMAAPQNVLHQGSLSVIPQAKASKTTYKKASIGTFVQKVTIKAKNTVRKQTESLAKITANQNIASQKSTYYSGGFLGLALALLIIGLVLSFVGFGYLGGLFIAIGVVVLVIGLVFFILWLVAEAV